MRYRDNPTWTNVVWCGASLACTLGAKFSGALFVPIALALLLVQNDKPGGLLKPIGVTALIAYALIHAMYMFPADPLAYWHGMRQVNANHNADYAVYLAGQFQIKPFSYFFYTYVLKEPLPTALLAMLGLAWTVTDKKRSIQQKAFLVLPGLGWFVAHLFLADPLGIRYIIVTVVAGHILGGFAIARLWGTARYVATALLAWAALSAIGSYPNHIPYFNEVACLAGGNSPVGLDGGSKCGPWWSDDSNVDWGQGLKQLKSWMDANAKGRRIRVMNPYGFPAEAYGIATEPLNGRELAERPPGLYAVSAHLFARLRPQPGEGNWMRLEKPIAVVGNAYYIFDLP